MTGVHIRRGNSWTQASIEEDVKTQEEDSQVQVKERVLEQVLPSWPSEGTNSANTLDF